MICIKNINLSKSLFFKGINLPVLPLIFSLLFPVELVAQPFSLDENIKPVELKLVNYNPADEKAKGMICVADITQTKDTSYFFIKGFDIYAPAYTGITAADPSGKINIGLYKATWRSPDASGTTDINGHWEKSFKTEGDYGIMVVPTSVPASYSLVIWTGKEAITTLPSVFTGDKVSDESDSKTFFEKNSLLIIVSLAALILVLVIFLIKNKRK